MENDAYWSLVSQTKDEINRQEFARKLAYDRLAVLTEILGSEDIHIQTSLHLRATRPRLYGHQEAIGWHRESFFGGDLTYAVNVWVPIENVDSHNTLRYVADSHQIPNEEIVVVSEPDPDVKRFLPGHKVGLLWAPKHITGGVDLNNHKGLDVGLGEAAIMSSQLIHGAAENKSSKIRFSVDFCAIAGASITESMEHYAGNKKTFFDKLN